ncbi:MAG: RNA degradosome polyphosphate kinase [Actinobacteria bacterium]|uniref:ATP-polyphosphate phosphotransferase n=1 Tax=freshwater metagenome TaxID=449393 RepID=A0A6J6BE24_9ZZZZ|nr:RNA degradosome polyphosphate kinase [Actinomycetota bacterium]MTA29551.1 RNA degradosome polyphosphate kinase [Actinomycetota bacterium]
MSEETMSIAIPDMGDLPVDRFLDRELSWLAFNQRVLELAEDATLPLLERVNFAGIFGSNLDEFFMVRVAGLKRRIATGLAVRSASGLEPSEVLAAISEEAHRLQLRQANLFKEVLEPELRSKGIGLTTWAELTEEQQVALKRYFDNQIFPVLTPLAVDPAHPFPYISGLSLNLAVVLRNPENGTEHFARVKVPPLLPRFVRVPGSTNIDAKFLPLEIVIGQFLAKLFAGMEILQHHTFRVTRNEDLEVDEDEGENLLVALEKELLRRRFGPPVRLEVASDINPQVLELLVRELDIEEEDVYNLPAPLDLTGLFEIASIKRAELHFPPHNVVTNRYLRNTDEDKVSFFRAIREREILLHHPYESFSTSVQEFLAQAAADPKVLAIKQTLYRTSGDSPIVDALIVAAEAGKQVLALVEIKARFDEQNNITWARKLEQAGVHVVYGIVGLKTHCKLSLVIRQEGENLRRYCHIGTGNYNPKTARFYEDYGLLTSREQVGEDLTRLFNQLSGFAPDANFKALLVSPNGVREGLTERIEREVDQHLAGKPAGIQIKVNSLVDEQIIDSLYKASQAGVPIDILVRGMCALKPGVPDLSHNIRVRSVLGRYLEHSRIFSFVNDGDPEIFIGSADMMHRNLDRRVEALVRIAQPDHIKELQDLFTLAMNESSASWHLESNGSWTRHQFDGEGKKLTDVQDELMRFTASRKALTK